MDFVSAAAQCRSLDGRAKPRTSDHWDERRKGIGLLRASGSCASRRHPLRANGHSRAAARGTCSAAADWARRQPSNRCAGRRQGPVPNLASGWFDPVGIQLETNVALWHGGAWSARESRPSGTRRRTGLFTRRRHHSFAPCRLIARPGSSRAAYRASSASGWARRSRAAWRIHCVVVVLADVSLARARSASGVPRWVRGKRRRVSRATASGVGNGARRRRLAGRAQVLALSKVVVGDRLFERPSNNGLEPSRPLSCAIMSLRRAAQTARWTDGERRTSDHFERRKSNRIWLLLKLGSFESSRCSLRASGHSRAAARCGPPSSNHRTCPRGGLTPGRLGRHGAFGLRRDVERVTFGHGFRSRSVRRVAPLRGWFGRSCPRERGV